MYVFVFIFLFVFILFVLGSLQCEMENDGIADDLFDSCLISRKECAGIADMSVWGVDEECDREAKRGVSFLRTGDVLVHVTGSVLQFEKLRTGMLSSRFGWR